MRIVIRINSIFLVCLSISGIVISNSQFMISYGLDSKLEMLSYIILIISILFNFFKNFKKNNLKNIVFLIMLILFFCLGIWLQALSFGIKIYLSFSMVIFAIVMTMSDGIIKDFSDLKKIGNTIFWALIISMILSYLNGNNMWTLAVEGGFSDYGFNGGLAHKNYFSISLFTSFTLLTISYLFYKKIASSLILILLESILIILSNSRTVWLLTILFLGIISLYIIKNIKKNQRIVLITTIVIVSIAFINLFYRMYILTSGSYMIRVKGLINYLNKFSYDSFIMLFGNAAMAFSDLSVDYAQKVRSVIGWDGTVELPLVSILIKNGCMGLIGYLIIYLTYIKKIAKINNFQRKIIGFSILLPLLFSALVENYIVNLHIVYSVVIYMVLVSKIFDSNSMNI
ncbi:hypothetical protein Si125_01740 [Streptococcus infantarius subsp. infantarius]|nr:hypothetical protein [Streptococcus infantarius subsp. infantarius]